MRKRMNFSTYNADIAEDFRRNSVSNNLERESIGSKSQADSFDLQELKIE